MTLIGSLILQPSLIGSVKVDRLTLTEPERIVYEALVEMHRKGDRPIDLMTITAHLVDRDSLAEVGGQQVIAAWIEEHLERTKARTGQV